VEMTPIQGSSNIEAIGYAEESRTLTVQFKGRKGAAGSIYSYAGVPPEMWHAFLNAPSKGQFFAAEIRQRNYQATRVQ
jgi:hypothetical protein